MRLVPRCRQLSEHESKTNRPRSTSAIEIAGGPSSFPAPAKLWLEHQDRHFCTSRHGPSVRLRLGKTNKPLESRPAGPSQHRRGGIFEVRIFSYGLKHHKRSKATLPQINPQGHQHHSKIGRHNQQRYCCRCSGVVLSMQADAHHTTPSHLGTAATTPRFVSTVSTILPFPRPGLWAGSWPVALGRAGPRSVARGLLTRCRVGDVEEERPRGWPVGGNGLAILSCLVSL